VQISNEKVLLLLVTQRRRLSNQLLNPAGIHNSLLSFGRRWWQLRHQGVEIFVTGLLPAAVSSMHTGDTVIGWRNRKYL
jgi:hypothetical protein